MVDSSSFYSKDNGLPDYVDFSEMSGSTKKVVINFIISECLHVAGKYDGKVYGGFVRDVLVPLLSNNGDYSKVSEWKDIDLWFTSESNAKTFVKDMGRKFKIAKHDRALTEENRKVLYSWPRIQYHLYIWNICVAWVDIVVYPEFPVNDFNVNHLTFCYKIPGVVSKYIWGDCANISVDGKVREESTAHNLQQAIIAKVAIMDRDHIDMLSDEEVKLERLHRIRDRYINRGWMVMVGDLELKLEDTESEKSWNDFIKKIKDHLYEKFLDHYMD